MEHRSLFQLLAAVVTKLQNKTDNNNHSSVLKELKMEMKKISCSCQPGTILEEPDDCTIAASTLQALLFLLRDSSMEVSLLSGTCLTSLAFQCLGKALCAEFLFYVIQTYQKADGVWPSLCYDMMVKKLQSAAPDAYETGLNLFVPNDASHTMKPEWFHLAILHGILSSKQHELLLYRNSPDSMPFVVQLFDIIQLLCSSLTQYYFHVFQLLSSWGQAMSNLLKKLHPSENSVSLANKGRGYFSVDSKLTSQMLIILEGNWENPTNGVSEAVKKLYRILLEAHVGENGLVEPREDLVMFLLNKTSKLSWSTKGKYIVLTSLLPYVSQKQFLEKCPDAPFSIILNIRLNYVASVIGEVYKILVPSSRQGSYDVINWRQLWETPITDVLMSSDMLLLQNVRNYILPWTLRNLPQAYECLITAIKIRGGNDLAEIVLLRVAKDVDILFDKEEAYRLIRKLLHHSSEQLRMEVYTFLCFSPKKAEPVDSIALKLIAEFLRFNLNIDSSAFYQRVTLQTKSLLVRIRDSVTSGFRNAKKKTLPLSQSDLQQLEFVNWLTSFALDNIFPAACYQRQRSCLQILTLVHEVFFISTTGVLKKEHPSASVSSLVAWADQNGLWNCLEIRDILRLIPCLSDFTDDTRLAAALLLKNFNWPDVTDEAFVDPGALIGHALTLCTSFHVKQTETGSLLLCLMFLKYVVGRGLSFNFCDLTFHGQRTEQYAAAHCFLLDLIDLVEKKLVKEKFSSCITTGSIHGIILAIHRCILHVGFLDEAFKFQPENFSSLVHKVVDLCEEVICFMLSVMCGKTQIHAPSFAEIGQALEDILVEKDLFMLESLDGCDNDAEPSNSDQQLLLSCCWHSIKNSCFLISELLPHIFNFVPGTNDQLQLANKVTVSLSTTLLRCRHKGVIEACSDALSKSCKLLLAADVTFVNIVKSLLKESLDSLMTNATISATRRSAGLPLLIQAIVSARKNVHNDILMPYTMERLLEAIDMPLPVPFDDKKDLPQAAAYHILKILTADASLAQQIIPWLGLIFSTCIDGFSSKSWALRNGALQLYGVLLPRLCGQKKTREDESGHNTILPSELFTRCPKLYQFLLLHFTTSIENHRSNRLGPELLPLLSLVAKLSPNEDSDSARKFVKDFQPLLLELLSSPLWYVRNMSSTALSSMLVCGRGTQLWIQALALTNPMSETNNNETNGILMVIQKLERAKNSGLSASADFRPAIERHLKALRPEQLCDFNIHLMLQVCEMVFEQSAEYFKSVYTRVTFERRMRKGLLKKYLFFLNLSMSTPSEVYCLIQEQAFQDHDVTEACIAFLLHAWNENLLCHESFSWKQMLAHLVTHLDVDLHVTILAEILKLVIHICSKEILDVELAVKLESHLTKLTTDECGFTVHALAVTTSSFCLKALLQSLEERHQSCLEFWVTKFYDCCHPRKPSLFRFHAAEFVANCGCDIVRYLSGKICEGFEPAVSILLSLCDGSLFLLQDEDEEIRHKVSVFPSNLTHDYEVSNLQFNVCLKVVCQLLTELLQDQDCFINHLWYKLQNFPTISSVLQAASTRKTTLFEQEFVNIFAEPALLTTEFANMLKIALVKLHGSDSEAWSRKIKIFATDTKYEIAEANYLVDNIVIGNTGVFFMDYLSQPSVYLAFVKLVCQSRTLCVLAEEDLSSLPDILCLLAEIKEETETLLSKLPKIALWEHQHLHVFYK